MSIAAEKGSDDQSKFKRFIRMLCGSINDDGDTRYETDFLANPSMASTMGISRHALLALSFESPCYSKLYQ